MNTTLAILQVFGPAIAALILLPVLIVIAGGYLLGVIVFTRRGRLSRIVDAAILLAAVTVWLLIGAAR